MTIELLPVRLALTIVAGLGALFVVSGLTRVLRIRHPALRSGLCALGVADVVMTALGFSSISIVFVRLTVAPAHVAQFLEPAAPIALAAWAGIAGGLVAVRLLRARRIGAGVRTLSALFPAPAKAVAMSRRAARVSGVRPVGILLVPDDVTPCVAGSWRHPRILVPAALWDRLPNPARRALLLHEYAHVRRRDPWRLLALGLLCDVFFFNWPLRRLAARWTEAWESAADRLALRAGATPLGLAQSVAAGLALPAVGRRAAPRLALAFAGSARGSAARLRDARRPTLLPALVLQAIALALLLPVHAPAPSAAGVRLAAPKEGPRGRLSVGVTWRANPLTAPVLPALLRRFLV